MFSLRSIDWILVTAIFPLLGAGLVTMNSFVGSEAVFYKQLLWIGISFGFFFAAGAVDWRFLKRGDIVVIMYGVLGAVLLGLFILGHVHRGAASWFSIGG